MVGVDGSSPFAPTKHGRKIKHLAATPGAFFLGGTRRCGKSGCRRERAKAAREIGWGFGKVRAGSSQSPVWRAGCRPHAGETGGTPFAFPGIAARVPSALRVNAAERSLWARGCAIALPELCRDDVGAASVLRPTQPGSRPKACCVMSRLLGIVGWYMAFLRSRSAGRLMYSTPRFRIESRGVAHLYSTRRPP